MTFRDRVDAGQQLAAKLGHLKKRNPVVLALPRGGVPVGLEIAQALLALGAVTDGGDPDVFIDRNLSTELAIPEDYITEETARQIKELERRRLVYRAGRAPLDIAGRAAIVVDDGIATGATMRVALQATRRRNPSWLVLAAPVAPPDTIERLRSEVDEVVCVDTPAGLGAIGYYYRDFHQVSDAEVTDILARAAQPKQPS
jgi:putative phosphoribosyl transferase